MSQRTGERANQEAKRSREVRWQYLIRNDQFRSEVRDLRKAFRDDDEGADWKRQVLIEKWRLAELPKDILREPVIPDDIPRKLEYYEQFLTRPPFGYPVEAIDPLNGEPGRYLNLKVDLHEPVDLLLYFIAETLREHRPATQGRRRLDKVNWQLAVYDLVEFHGKAFNEVASLLQKRTRTLRGRLNSIRSAYAVAKRKILQASGMTECDSQGISHSYDKCSVCKIAARPEQFCAKGRAQLGEGTRGQRDLDFGAKLDKVPEKEEDKIDSRRLGHHPPAE